MFGKYLEDVRKNGPLVNCITNYVTANNTANALYAVGARPIMSDAVESVEDVMKMSKGVCINMGTFTAEKLKTMMAVGSIKNGLDRTVVIDPVGVAGITFRRDALKEYFEKHTASVLCGNASEIKAAVLNSFSATGVDAGSRDKVTGDNLKENVDLIKRAAAEKNMVIVMTGAVDIVSDGHSSFVIENGREEMGKVTGTGCMLSALVTAFVSADPKDAARAAAAAVCTMGVAGEIAWENMTETDGNAAYSNRIIDALYNMKGSIIDKYEEVRDYEE